MWGGIFVFPTVSPSNHPPVHYKIMSCSVAWKPRYFHETSQTYKAPWNFTDIKHHETTCRTHESQLWFSYFQSFSPWNIVNSDFCHIAMSTYWDIFMLVYTNAKHHETTCRTQEPYLVYLLLELWPFEHWKYFIPFSLMLSWICWLINPCSAE